MAPRRKNEHPIEVHPEYIAELRRRVEAGPGAAAVARAAGMSRMTVWSLLHNPVDRRATPEAAERVRLALVALAPNAEPMPPPVVSIRDQERYRWFAFGDALLAAHPDAVKAALDAPAKLKAAVLGVAPRSRRR